MGFNRFRIRVSLWVAALFATILLVAWTVVRMRWYATGTLLTLAALTEAVLLVLFITRSHHELARFLDAVAVDDMSQGFSELQDSAAHAGLSAAMSHALTRLRAGRAERDEQVQYLQALVDHTPVALISMEECGKVSLLNIAARRLFGPQLSETAQFARYGTSFSTGMQALRAGTGATLRMERPSSTLQLKVTATDLVTRAGRCKLVSFQNIGQEMTAQEMAAWQTVIRIMAHEVMNSLTPVSSLATTARALVHDVLEQLPVEDPRAASLIDASEALETLARRSEGLSHFVRNHRRLTRALETRPEITSVKEVFARLQRLLGPDLAARSILMTTTVMPETLEITVDPDLLDQALINLVRNAIEALRDTPEGVIALSGGRDVEGHVTLTVSDNGPGIPEEHREKVFVPFFTTKRQGSGIGLTLVRQIASAHGATVTVSEGDRGGAVVSLHF